jgi:hypothetical protein
MREVDAEAVRTGLAHQHAGHRKPCSRRGILLIVLGVASVSLGTIAVGVATCVVATRFSRLTEARDEVRARLLRLRVHLKTTFAKDGHSAEPGELRDPRERLLPYAVLFGLERTRLEPPGRQSGSGETFDYAYLTNTFS